MKLIAHISDLHFGTEIPELLSALRQDLRSVKPDLIVVSGDLTQRARTAQFRAAREFLETLPAPRLVVPGNHDVPLYDVVRRMFAPLARYRRWIDPSLDPIHDDGELMVAGINTARSLTWKSGRISVGQIARLHEQLRRTAARYRVVVTHHPFIPPPIENAAAARIDLVGRADRALKVLDAGRVDLLLAGHLHHSYSGDTRTQYPASHRAIVSAQAGTATSRRIRQSDPNAYNLIEFAGEHLTVEIRSWMNGAFSTAKCARFRRDEHGWSPHLPGIDG